MNVAIRGEYWFDEYGDTMYADGDVGDMNHEAYVIQRCAMDVLDFFNIKDDDVNNLNTSYIDDILATILNEDAEWAKEYIKTKMKHHGFNEESDYNDKELLEFLQDDPASVIIQYLVDEFNMSEDDASALVLIGMGSGRDARKYAIEKWNWTAVRGRYIEVNKLNIETLRIVARGIIDILSEEGLYEDEKWDEANQQEYHISTYTGKRYTITLKDMENGNVEGLERSDVEMNHPTAATQQLRQMDFDTMPDFYKNKGILGDSFNNIYNTLLEKYGS